MPGLGVHIQFPLPVAVAKKHHDVVVWLLSRGADPNGNDAMYYGAVESTADILLLLIDAGGGVNRECDGRAPLFWAVHGNSEDKVRVLLAQPTLDFTITSNKKTPEQYARDSRRVKPAVAALISQEVRIGLQPRELKGSRRGIPRCNHIPLSCLRCWRCCGLHWQRARRAALVRLLLSTIVPHKC